MENTKDHEIQVLNEIEGFLEGKNSSVSLETVEHITKCETCLTELARIRKELVPKKDRDYHLRWAVFAGEVKEPDSIIYKKVAKLFWKAEGSPYGTYETYEKKMKKENQEMMKMFKEAISKLNITLKINGQDAGIIQLFRLSDEEIQSYASLFPKFSFTQFPVRYAGFSGMLDSVRDLSIRIYIFEADKRKNSKLDVAFQLFEHKNLKRVGWNINFFHRKKNIYLENLLTETDGIVTIKFSKKGEDCFVKPLLEGDSYTIMIPSLFALLDYGDLILEPQEQRGALSVESKIIPIKEYEGEANIIALAQPNEGSFADELEKQDEETKVTAEVKATQGQLSQYFPIHKEREDFYYSEPNIVGSIVIRQNDQDIECLRIQTDNNGKIYFSEKIHKKIKKYWEKREKYLWEIHKRVEEMKEVIWLTVVIQNREKISKAIPKFDSASGCPKKDIPLNNTTISDILFIKGEGISLHCEFDSIADDLLMELHGGTPKIRSLIKLMILYKEEYLFSISVEYQENLNNNSISKELQEEFEKSGRRLTQDVSTETQVKGSKWLIKEKTQEYDVIRDRNTLNIYLKQKDEFSGKEIATGGAWHVTAEKAKNISRICLSYDENEEVS